VALGEESAAAKDSWFVDALEDTSTSATVKSRLGEGDIPSSSEASVDPEKGIPSVVKKGSAPGGSPPVEPQADPMLPEEPSNPYGQLVSIFLLLHLTMTVISFVTSLFILLFY